MNGFQRELKERILRYLPHASWSGNIPLEKFEDFERRASNEEVLGVAPYIENSRVY